MTVHTGLHIGFLLPSVLDGSAVSLSQTAGGWNPVGGVRVHKEYMGARHILCEWEAVILPHRHHF